MTYKVLFGNTKPVMAMVYLKGDSLPHTEQEFRIWLTAN